MFNTWNSFRPSYAGIVGIGAESPIWRDVYKLNTAISVKQYVVDFDTSTVSLGDSYNASIFNSSTNMTVNATNTTANAPQFSLTEFGFGMVYNDSTAYFADLLNSDSTEYGNFANTTGFSLETSSLLLPETQYLKFANLLAIATQGASNCPDVVGGLCVLPGTC